VKEHTSREHTQHLSEDKKTRQVFVIRNRSNGIDMRMTLHQMACTPCADHLLSCVWPGWNILAGLNPQSDESPATSSDRPSGDPEPPPPSR